MAGYATLSFALAAVFGATMAVLNQRRKSIPWPLPAAHGAFAAIGLILLVILMLRSDPPIVVWASFGLFIMAAIGGSIIFKSYLRKEMLPTGLIIIHAMLALMGLLFLGSFLYANSVIEGPVEGSWVDQEIEEGR